MNAHARCDFCWRECVLEEGQQGPCGIRKNSDGKVVTLGYGQVVASGVDPVEKKPMYHLLPGSKTFSFALFGCNYTCSFCQNHLISQADSPYWPGSSGYRPRNEMSVEHLVKMLERSGAPIMSFTYSEPIVWQDFMLETAQQVHALGKLNCMVTNGSFSDRSLERVLQHIDAFNIDVKGGSQFYRTYCGGVVEPVLDALSVIASAGNKVLEVTTLVIEGVHTPDEIALLARQLSDRGVQVWHLSRFFPQYRMNDHPPTSERFLAEMLSIASESDIPHIYAGNSNLGSHQSTRCPSCSATLIKSHGYGGEARSDAEKHIIDGRCANCGATIHGRFG